MNKVVFTKISKIVYEQAGIVLKEGKEELVNARLSKRMRALGLNTHRKYLNYLCNDNSGNELIQLLDAISTNLTNFYREPRHFDIFTKIMKNWIKQGLRKFRIWCSAASTGEEPYTIAITMLEQCADINPDIKILATDISTEVLEKCLVGRYDKDRINNIPIFLRDKYFIKHGRNNNSEYEVKDILKNLIVFRRLNLSAPPFPMHGPMDAIFCRNVMIYFDNTIRKKLLDEAWRLLKPGGFLFVGHAESLTSIVSDFKCIEPAVYIKDSQYINKITTKHNKFEKREYV